MQPTSPRRSFTEKEPFKQQIAGFAIFLLLSTGMCLGAGAIVEEKLRQRDEPNPTPAATLNTAPNRTPTVTPTIKSKLK